MNRDSGVCTCFVLFLICSFLLDDLLITEIRYHFNDVPGATGL